MQLQLLMVMKVCRGGAVRAQLGPFCSVDDRGRHEVCGDEGGVWREGEANETAAVCPHAGRPALEGCVDIREFLLSNRGPALVHKLPQVALHNDHGGALGAAVVVVAVVRVGSGGAKRTCVCCGCWELRVVVHGLLLGHWLLGPGLLQHVLLLLLLLLLLL